MILDEHVEIVLNPRHIIYWEEKGYVVPRERDKWGRLKVKRDAKLNVKVSDLSKNSHVLVSCKCEKCGVIRNIQYNQYRRICVVCVNALRSGEDHPCYGIKRTVGQLNKARDTKVKKGTWIPDDKLDDFLLYRRRVKRETNKWKSKLFEVWDGFDYYTGERLIGNIEFAGICPNLHINRNKLQPTIDHKTIVHMGFIKNIDHMIIGGIDNLCICSKVVNSTKNHLSEKQYNEKKLRIK